MEGSHSLMQRRSLCSWVPVERILAVDGCPPDERGWTGRNWTLDIEIANQFTKDLQRVAFQKSNLGTHHSFDLPLPSSSVEELSMIYCEQPQNRQSNVRLVITFPFHTKF
ncbi:hypothetical protein CEXT_324171 [Caerostris extrusa]|uniref:Uncharacterized protein n=1 Tax=Caerostris extrusa TaxID=172846 RepID=A0AAV4XSD4_CAEEX|nr:hypothetical protein CEXT_324171 [Caerostris extrusa]